MRVLKIVHNTKADLSEYLSFLRSLRMENGQFFSRFQHKNGSGVEIPLLISMEKRFSPSQKRQNIWTTQNVFPTLWILLKPCIHRMSPLLFRKTKTATPQKDFINGEVWHFTKFSQQNGKEANRMPNELLKWHIGWSTRIKFYKNSKYSVCPRGNYFCVWTGISYERYQSTRIFSECYWDRTSKLTSWQVGNSLENSYLKANVDTTDQKAIGGIMNSKDEPTLRIDVTQHQMHAVLLYEKFPLENTNIFFE